MLITDKRTLAAAYRHGPYAWPGGYPAYLLMQDGEMICWTCFREEYREIAEASTNPSYSTGWEPYGLDVLWEGPELCAHCTTELQSAYGDTTEGEQ